MKRRRRRLAKSLDGVSTQDFVAAARILCKHGAAESLVTDFADYFGSKNPRFLRDRFLRAAKSCKR